jgi:CheY-like chemotaxis protein
MQSYALIVDPDVSAATVYVAAVRDEGLTYVSVRDGARAMAVLAERGTPDVLITEITLPGFDGLELVDRVRRAPSGADTAVILVSADRDLRERAGERRASLELGAVLSKSATGESIRRVLKRLRDARDAPLPAALAVRAHPEGGDLPAPAPARRAMPLSHPRGRRA